MAKKANKQTIRGRNQDRARVAGGQKYKVQYEANKTRKSASAIKKVVKKVGSNRKRVEKALKEGGDRGREPASGHVPAARPPA